MLRNINTHRLFAIIEPPFFESISFLKFSPSGRLLLVANENCQYFYVYEILPATSLRVQGAGGPNNQSIGFLPTEKQELVRLQYYLYRGITSAIVTDVEFVSTSNVQTDLEQLIVINTSIGTSHIYNLNKYQNQNRSPVIKSADYECGGINSTKALFFEQQLQQMNVKNVEAEIRFRYNEAAEQSQQVSQSQNESSAALFTEQMDNSTGISTLINKAAAGAGILAQTPHYNCIVSSLRQEWDPQLQAFQYQLQTYTSKNEYFIIDIGTRLGEQKQVAQNAIQRELQDVKQNTNHLPLRARLSQAMFPLNISIEYIIPILHQD